MADDCLDEYTDHGHCGLLTDAGEVDNDATLERYATHRGRAGRRRRRRDRAARDDGRPGRRDPRRARRDRATPTTAILAYAAKYASALYGPFRDAAECAPQFGDRRGYQMDPANAREALDEVALDVAEGADMVMVKPALAVPRRRSPRCATAFDVPGRGVPRERRVRDGEGRGRSSAGSTATRSRSSTCSRSSGPAPTSCSPTSRARSPKRLHAIVSSLVRARRRRASRAASTRRCARSASVGGEPFFVARARRRRTSSTPTAASYLDYVQSWGASILGHAHPTVVEAVQRAAADGTSYGAPTAARGRARRGDLRARAVGREGAARVVGHRGGDDRGAARARRDRPRRRS